MLSYFKYINPSFLEDRAKNRVEQLVSKLPADEAQYPTGLKGKTREEAIDSIKGSMAIFGSISLITSISFLFLFMMSVFYSILSPIIYKKVVLRM